MVRHAASLVLLFAFAASSGPVPAAAEEEASRTPVSLEALAWLAGRWEEADGASVFTETWNPPRGDAMVAASHWVVGGETRMYELVVIEQTEKGPVLYVRHFHRGVEPWAAEKDGPLSFPLASLTARHVVFEHPTRAWPRRLEYRREGDVLHGRLSGVEDGEPKAIPLRFLRAD